MAPTERQRSIKEVGSSIQAPTPTSKGIPNLHQCISSR